jgi:hypothetical protein
VNEYCLTVTYKCNWFCDYCIVHTHEQQEPTFQSIKDNIKTIIPGSDIAMTGGEPGLASKEIVKYVIDELHKINCRVFVNTNGLFFSTHKEFHPVVDGYFYHCSENLDNYVPDVGYDNIDYMIVVTDDNFKNLDSFMTTNDHLENLYIYGADETTFNGKTTTGLSKSNAIKIYKKYKHKLHPNSLKYLLSTTIVTNKDLIKI